MEDGEDRTADLLFKYKKMSWIIYYQYYLFWKFTCYVSLIQLLTLLFDIYL